MRKFKIIKERNIGNNCLVCLYYPKTDKEKNLLILGMNSKDVKKTKDFDTEFRNSMPISDPFVFAEMHPSKMGWKLGIDILRILNFEYIKKER